MANKNNTKYAILGILSIQPGTGYDIKKYCDTVLSNFWNENYGHIYPVLKKLLDDELIQLKDNSADPKKKEYMITEKGREEYFKWLEEPVEYSPIRSEFLLKFIFSSNLPKVAVMEMLEEYEIRQWRKLDKLREMEKSMKNDPNITKERGKYIHATIQYGIYAAKAAIAWCNDTMKIMNE